MQNQDEHSGYDKVAIPRCTVEDGHIIIVERLGGYFILTVSEILGLWDLDVRIHSRGDRYRGLAPASSGAADM
mgnify:CR=1 FL=1